MIYFLSDDPATLTSPELSSFWDVFMRKVDENRAFVKGLTARYLQSSGGVARDYATGMQMLEALVPRSQDVVIANTGNGFFVFVGSLAETIAKLTDVPKKISPPIQILAKMTLLRILKLTRLREAAVKAIEPPPPGSTGYVYFREVYEQIVALGEIPHDKAGVMGWVEKVKALFMGRGPHMHDLKEVGKHLRRDDITEEVVAAAWRLHVAHGIMTE